jgi:hypothetical protein
VAHNWELGLFASFFDQLYSIRLKKGSVDKIYWNPYKRGVFYVRKFYNVLFPHDSTHFLGGIFGGIKLL